MTFNYHLILLFLTGLLTSNFILGIFSIPSILLLLFISFIYSIAFSYKFHIYRHDIFVIISLITISILSLFVFLVGYEFSGSYNHGNIFLTLCLQTMLTSICFLPTIILSRSEFNTRLYSVGFAVPLVTNYLIGILSFLMPGSVGEFVIRFHSLS